MYSIRLPAALLATLLLFGLNLAHADDKLLVPSNPPPAHGMVALDVSAAELLLDLPFTEAQPATALLF